MTATVMGAVTEPEAGTSTPPPGPPRAAGVLRLWLDPVLGLCALALIAFPVVCALAASRAPVDPRPAQPRWPAGSHGPRVQYLPAFDPRGAYAGLGARPLLDDAAAVRALVEPELS